MNCIPSNLAQKKQFYDNHINFAKRTLIDYYLSPGTMAKYQIMKSYLGARHFSNALDIGCSGNSFLPFLDHISNRYFVDLAHRPLTQYSQYKKYHPLVGSITQLPFHNGKFELVSALDVLEHIHDDKGAAKELVRVLHPQGILLITVPHRMQYYSHQDVIIGHYRRYEIPQLEKLFTSLEMERIACFGVYGQAMRYAQFSQGANPEKMEEDLQILRHRYETNPLFQKLWDKLVFWGSKLMKWDARFQPDKNLMNICMVFQNKRKN